MIFCPKCGSLLMPKKEKNTTVLSCKCGYTNKKESFAAIKETMVNDSRKIEIVGNEEEKTLPLTEGECGRCGHKKAYYWTVQTRASDEPETKFLKCQKCAHTWRDYA